jgi:hypothetical protein
MVEGSDRPKIATRTELRVEKSRGDDYGLLEPFLIGRVWEEESAKWPAHAGLGACGTMVISGEWQVKQRGCRGCEAWDGLGWVLDQSWKSAWSGTSSTKAARQRCTAVVPLCGCAFSPFSPQPSV